MSTGASNEKKKDRSKNRQLKNQVTPAMRQVHVVLWDEPPKADPQEENDIVERIKVYAIQQYLEIHERKEVERKE